VFKQIISFFFSCAESHAVTS